MTEGQHGGQGEGQHGGPVAPARDRTVRRRLRALAVLHPAPSIVNAVLVATLALVAGADSSVAGVLAVGMLGFQFSIGALNDLADVEDDRRAGRDKPIPAGLVSVSVARGIVIAGAVVGFVASAGFGATVLFAGALGYGAGVAYDVGLRRRGLAWLCFALAFPALLAWTWLAAANALPPAWPFLLPLAALAGPAIHLANSLVDADTDEAVGVASLARRLGATRAREVLVALTTAVYLLGWIVLLSLLDIGSSAIIAAACSTAAAAIGVSLSWQQSRKALDAGWLLQAISLGAFGVVLVASVG